MTTSICLISLLTNASKQAHDAYTDDNLDDCAEQAVDHVGGESAEFPTPTGASLEEDCPYPASMFNQHSGVIAVPIKRSLNLLLPAVIVQGRPNSNA